MTEKKRASNEQSESSGNTPGEEKESTLGRPEVPYPGEAEEGATEAVPAPEVAVPAEKRVELTEKELAELKKRAEERDEYLDILLHTKADFSNYQKRMKRELESMGRYATQELVKALIPAMDHLSRA
ncbi:MAG: nucleotide exchange factor GrpE, partial [Candidatus Brocadiales bacterium]